MADAKERRRKESASMGGDLDGKGRGESIYSIGVRRRKKNGLESKASNQSKRDKRKA